MKVLAMTSAPQFRRLTLFGHEVMEEVTSSEQSAGPSEGRKVKIRSLPGFGLFF